jgi:hypothetical protein
LLGVRANQRLVLVLDRKDAVADGHAIHRQCHDPAGAFAGDDLEMVGLAADDHADADIAVILAAFRGQRDRAGNFQCAGHGEDIDVVSRRFERGACAGHEHVVEMVVETGFDDKETGHGGHSGMGRWSTMLRP